MRAKEPIKKLCEYCGKEFQASRQDTLYCSHDCNRKAYREAKRKEVIALTETLVSKKKIEQAVVDLSDREYLSISEAAKVLGWCKQSVYNYCHKGIIPAKRISQRTTLIRKKDIESLFDAIEPYEVLTTGERKPIESWYTLDDITEKYGLLRHRIRKIVNAEEIPTKKDGTRTLIAKGKIDAYFKKKGFDGSLNNLADWLTISGVMEEYEMTEQGVYVFVSRYSIPKKRVNGKLYYSKQHIDKLKNKGQ
ncbi:helix-turn-helix domain-containing protein [Bacteroides graminisolvens]|jgi:transposase|uniref:helix-turn-helix domain-containing protein n=1 Tax=Bacteroides graminisolvens TaxID=477666 RepID=UPI0029C63214|nr:helix-turn-helix domain-containing protein [Bacteroides graminisolvens]